MVALVPQEATDLLFCDSVAAECLTADRATGSATGSTRSIFERLVGAPLVDDRVHPRDLSDGQRLALALAVQLSARPRALLLDEPTRGLDYTAKARLARQLVELADDGMAIVVATHDVEFVAHASTRVVVLAEGEVVTAADTQEALSASPLFAPQVAKVLAPLPWLTVDQVAAAKGVSEAGSLVATKGPAQSRFSLGQGRRQ